MAIVKLIKSQGNTPWGMSTRHIESVTQDAAGKVSVNVISSEYKLTGIEVNGTLNEIIDAINAAEKAVNCCKEIASPDSTQAKAFNTDDTGSLLSDPGSHLQ